ncbi:MAG: hydroxypyruvate isomerase family protein [Planctomycetaceae bacterium]
MPLSRRDLLASTALLGIAGTNSPCLAAEPAPGAIDPKTPGKTPHTRFAVNVEMWFRKLPFLDRIRAAADLGFPAVEFWPHEGKDIPAIARLCAERKIAISQFTAWGFKPGLNEPKNHPAFVQAIEKGCQVAKDLNCSLMTVVAGDDVPGLTQEQMHQNTIEGLKRGGPIAEKHGITLILEPMNIRVDHKGHCLYGSAPTMKIIAAVNSPAVKINWDLYHMHITEGDLCGHLREGFQAGHIGYLQLADHPGRNEPGTGEIHYNRVLKEAHDLGYRGYVGLELNPKTTELAAALGCAQADLW